LKVLKQRGLFFIDSRTSYDTVSRGLARNLKLPYAQRKIFLDNNTSPEKIKIQLEQLIRYARKRGEAVGIAHPHEKTFRVLAEEIPKLKQRIRFVPASSIVHIVGG
ncbi:MAG: divergent polysaccharide deacetylase family protein, partial [Thermodesulfobacteriota bacterium]|nr:divergent polysaccharide deacetylase family protein [Thermodesulfobacteriota bacterium]